MVELLSKVPGDPVTGVLDLAAQGVQIAQNEQIKSGIELLRQLQTAGLALNAASIGISIAGFAMLNHKIAALEAGIDSIHSDLEKIDAKLDALWREPWARDCRSLRTLAEKLDESWFLTDGRGELADIANEAHELAGQFYRQAQEALESDAVFLVAAPAVEAFALASALRITARLAMDENKAALEASLSSTGKMSELLGRMSPVKTAVLELQSRGDLLGTSEWDAEIAKQRTHLIEPVSRLRRIEASSAARGVTLESLLEQGVSGRDWLETASREDKSPLLVWEVKD
ncbi:MAG: hypothetical protein V2I43_27455 [Parvularcula sp.]|jgi:hypothetical protein|nr:hypothetical protein [Parvularcula sp.]